MCITHNEWIFSESYKGKFSLREPQDNIFGRSWFGLFYLQIFQFSLQLTLKKNYVK